MIADIRTIVWKEWKEMLFLRSTRKGGLVASLIIPLLILGVFVPWNGGAEFFRSGAAPLIWIWLPMFIGASMVVDSFAGERERKTLETLLASRLSDRAILFGKTAAVVAYSWGLVLAAMVLGLITVNAVHGRGELIVPAARTLAAVIVFSLLAALLSSLAGILISLRASTVRAATQTVSIVLMATIFGLVAGARAAPAEWRRRALAALAGSNLLTFELIAAAALVILDAILLSAAMARFRRARLILD